MASGARNQIKVVHLQMTVYSVPAYSAVGLDAGVLFEMLMMALGCMKKKSGQKVFSHKKRKNAEFQNVCGSCCSF